MMRITKKLLAIVLSLCVLASLCACKDEKTKNENNNETQTSQTETQNVGENENAITDANASQDENAQTEDVEESKKIEYTQITEKEFSELVEQANSDDEQIKKEALAKLQVILDEVEQNSPKN